MLHRIICIVLLVAFPLIAHAATAPLSKTGQTTCYDSAGNVISCPGTGQDGDKQAGVSWPTPRFTDNFNGTVTDNLTGLVWLKSAECLVPQTWSAALASANSLHDGQCGLTDNSVAGDWRLPNVVELESLFDMSQVNPALPAANPFTVYSGWYWTSSTHAQINANVWCSNVANGNVQAAVKISNLYRVWPVAGQKEATIRLPKTGETTCWDESGNVIACAGTGEDGEKQSGVAWPSPRFLDNGNGTITDNLTGLIWMKNANCFGIQTWQRALDSSNALASGICGLIDGSTAGQWRLPNRKELLRLTNYQQPDNTIWLTGQGFGNVWGDWYWSSDSVTGTPNEKWLVHAQVGGARPQHNVPIADGYYVISVRDPVTPNIYFVISAPTSVRGGSSFSFTVTAFDGNNQVATGYTGTVYFTSSDSAATLPVNSTLTNGVGTFTATLKTAGNQTITATDTGTTLILGTSNVIAVSAVADLTVTKSHKGSFKKGQTGATYRITVRNSGTGPTSGAVTVTDTLPSGLKATAISGSGWVCDLSTLTCTHSTLPALAAGSSYPAITLTVSVDRNASTSVLNIATVSGGGEVNTDNDTASDLTIIK